MAHMSVKMKKISNPAVCVFILSVGQVEIIAMWALNTRESS